MIVLVEAGRWKLFGLTYVAAERQLAEESRGESSKQLNEAKAERRRKRKRKRKTKTKRRGGGGAELSYRRLGIVVVAGSVCGWFVGVSLDGKGEKGSKGEKGKRRRGSCFWFPFPTSSSHLLTAEGKEAEGKLSIDWPANVSVFFRRLSFLRQ